MCTCRRISGFCSLCKRSASPDREADSPASSIAGKSTFSSLSPSRKSCTQSSTGFWCSASTGMNVMAGGGGGYKVLRSSSCIAGHIAGYISNCTLQDTAPTSDTSTPTSSPAIQLSWVVAAWETLLATRIVRETRLAARRGSSAWGGSVSEETGRGLPEKMAHRWHPECSVDRSRRLRP